MKLAEQQASLSLEHITQTAIRMIEQDGFDSISMRKLAAQCGVPVMTLYGYVNTKEELLALVADALLAQIELPPMQKQWQDQVRQIFCSVYQAFNRHPGLADIVARQHINVMSAFRGAEQIFRTFSQAGLKTEDVVSAFVTLVSYTVGFAQRQAFIEAQPAQLAQRMNRLQELAGSDFEYLPQLATTFVTRLTDNHFEDGLDIVISGIEDRISHE